jgi:hypothetical protein
MKMGTIFSPWRHDAGIRHTPKAATGFDIALRRTDSSLPDVAGQSGLAFDSGDTEQSSD